MRYVRHYVVHFQREHFTLSVICDDVLLDRKLSHRLDERLSTLQRKLSDNDNQSSISVCDDTICIRGTVQHVLKAHVLAEEVRICQVMNVSLDDMSYYSTYLNIGVTEVLWILTM